MYAGDRVDEPDNMRVYEAHAGASPVCEGGVAGCSTRIPSVYRGNVCKSSLG